MLRHAAAGHQWASSTLIILCVVGQLGCRGHPLRSCPARGPLSEGERELVGIHGCALSLAELTWLSLCSDGTYRYRIGRSEFGWDGYSWMGTWSRQGDDLLLTILQEGYGTRLRPASGTFTGRVVDGVVHLSLRPDRDTGPPAEFQCFKMVRIHP